VLSVKPICRTGREPKTTAREIETHVRETRLYTFRRRKPVFAGADVAAAEPLRVRTAIRARASDRVVRLRTDHLELREAAARDAHERRLAG
jgi:hypothetical protein